MSDLRSAIRALAAARGFAAISILTLGIALALCVTVLTVVNAYIVRGLPYPDADRLMRLEYAAPGQNPPRGLEALDWASLDDVIDTRIAWDLDVFYLLGHEYPESIPGAWVTPGYLDGFGVRAAQGRSFAAGDFAPGSPAVAMIGHRVWQTRFHSDPNIVGQTFRAYVSDRPAEPEAFTIVGVLPADLWHLNVYTDVLAPLRAPSYPYMARLRAGVPPGIAAQRVTALVRQGIASVPPDFHAVVTPVHDGYVTTVRPLLWSVAAAAALVLLIADANVAILMLVRGRRRQKELAVRLALGASHARVARLLITEAVLIGGAATVLGIAVSQFALANVSALVERVLERRVPGGLAAFERDFGVWLAAGACGFVVTLIFTLAPLAAAWGARLSPGLSSGARGLTNSAGARRSHSDLIGIEVAASLTLLVGAALMAESAIRMLRVDFGVEADRVVTASLALRDRSFPDDASRVAFFDRLTSELTGLGGATSIALGDWWPLQGSRPRRVDTGGATPAVASANPFAVSAGYFETLGMSIRDGRAFSMQDRIGTAPVVVISESLAQRLWPGQRAVGNQLTMYADDESATPRHVIGVVNDVRQSHTDVDLNDAYLSLAQRPRRFAFLYLRTPNPPAWESDLRRTVARVDSEVAVGAPRSLALGLEQERTRPQFLAFLLTVFAVLASVLALVGMHGVIAYAVRQRQREIAVRIAIGATSRAVTSMFLRDGLWVLAGGVIAGLAGAVGLGRVLQSQLHGLQPVEPRILAAAAIAFVICGLLAIGWPARNAASVDPSLVLKEE